MFSFEIPKQLTRPKAAARNGTTIGRPNQFDDAWRRSNYDERGASSPDTPPRYTQTRRHVADNSLSFQDENYWDSGEAMPLCRFWAQGNCRNGNNCRFDHPPLEQLNSPRNQPQQSRGGGRAGGASGRADNRFEDRIDGRTDNRFGDHIVTDNRSYNYRPNDNRGQYSQDRSPRLPPKPSHPFSLTKEGIIDDLTVEAPQWVLSAYGPGLKAPIQLFGGPERERCFEEMRLQYYEGRALGQEAVAARAEDEMVFKAKQQMKMAYDNADEALQYVLRGADEHPNRIDMCSEKPLSTINTRGLFQTAPRGAISQQGIQFDQKGGAFGGAQQPATNGTFGQPSAFGAPIPSPFGQPAFGQPAASTPNPLAQPAFGQPSFGQPAFGQSSSGQPAFGQPANPQAAFGQPSAPQPAFGQSSASQSAFGQPSFGQPAAPSGQFGTQTQGLFRPLPPAANPNPFGSVPKPNANAFGQSAVQPQFGQPRSSVDGSMSPAQTSQPNPFGTQPSQQAFQQQQLNPFEGGQQQASPFGANQQPTQPNPFQAFNPNAAPSQGFQPNGAAQNNSQATLEVQHPAINTYASVGPDGRINMFKGKRVEWRDGVPGIVRDGLWEKIWFPQAAPSRDPAANMPDEAYDEATKAAYLHFRQTGGFQNDTMPLLPPKMEWCKYDF